MVTPQHKISKEGKIRMKNNDCKQVIEENNLNDKARSQQKQFMAIQNQIHELVFSKFTNAIQGCSELAIFLDFCQMKVIRIVNIHDLIDYKNKLFLETKPYVPDEATVLRKVGEYLAKL